jgi:hypothetical protein
MVEPDSDGDERKVGIDGCGLVSGFTGAVADRTVEIDAPA